MQLYFLDPTTRIIVATPSNSAADSFVEALVNTKRFTGPHDFIRFVSYNQLDKGLIQPEFEKYCGSIGIDSQVEVISNGILFISPLLTKILLLLDIYYS